MSRRFSLSTEKRPTGKDWWRKTVLIRDMSKESICVIYKVMSVNKYIERRMI